MQRAARTSSISASTLLEAVIAVAIVAVFLSGIYQMNGHALGLLKSGLEGVSGTRMLANTMEQIRAGTWEQATDATFLSGILQNTSPSGHLTNVSETIDINTIPPLSTTKISVNRDTSGTVTITSPGDGSIPTRIAATVDVTITWKTTFNSRTHTRMMSAYLSPGGIMGRNQ